MKQSQKKLCLLTIPLFVFTISIATPNNVHAEEPTVTSDLLSPLPYPTPEQTKLRVEPAWDEDGNKISVVRVYDLNGRMIENFNLQTQDGKKAELKIEEGGVEFERATYKIKEKELEFKVRDLTEKAIELIGYNPSNIKITVAGQAFKISRAGAYVLAAFPLILEDTSGKVVVNVSSGEAELKALPDTIKFKAEVSDTIDEVELMELEETSGANKLVYKITGSKAEKLFGLFRVKLPAKQTYDAQSGRLIKAERAGKIKVLDALSI